MSELREFSQEITSSISAFTISLYLFLNSGLVISSTFSSKSFTWFMRQLIMKWRSSVKAP